MVSTILSITNTDVEIAITVPKHPEAHEFITDLLGELGLDFKGIVDERGAERTPRELSDAYRLYGSDSSSVSVVWGADVIFLLIRPADREQFAQFLIERSAMHAP